MNLTWSILVCALLLDGITRYDYSDEYMSKLITAIMELNEIRDDLDHCGEGNRLKDNKAESFRIAREMVNKAKEKRD